MTHEQLRARFLEPARTYIRSLSKQEQGAIAADIEMMEKGDDSSVQTKQLQGAIRELKFGNHRLTYFKLEAVLYFVRGFRKKSAKTPKKEIEFALRIYKTLKGTT